MKKIFILTILSIIIPYLVISIFIKNNEVKFKYNENMSIRVKRNEEIINIPFEEYILGVISGEMSPTFNIEAIKAQAVAARSYAMVKMQNNINNDYDVVDTTYNQVYLSHTDLKNKWKENYQKYISKMQKAISETKNEYMEYKGKIVEALYFSTSTGVTENSEEVFQEKLDYLRSVKSEWDKNVSPVYTTTASFTIKQFYQLLDIPFSQEVTVKIIQKTSTGRVTKLQINDTLFNATDVQKKLSLKSTFFSIKQDGNKIIVNVKGYGHGVGMSQYGAEGMARAGYNYKEILKHYYKGIEIKKI